MSTPKKKSTTKKSTTKNTTPKASKPEDEEVVEEFITDDEVEEPNKAQELWGTFKDSVSKIPHGIEEKENKLKLTTSKLFALTGSLVAFFEGRELFLSYASLGTTAYSPIVGAVGMLIGLFLLVTILADLILAAKAIKGKIPYEWYILLPSGLLLFFLNLFAAGGGVLFIKGGILLMLGGIILLLEGLKLKKATETKIILILIGIVLGLFESAMEIFTDSGNFWAWFTGIIMFLVLLLLFFATGLVKLPEKISPPLTWWLVLAIAVAMYYFGFDYQLSSIVLIHVFLLELIDL
ncbi:MAG: hypothetical protein E4G98_01020 [Promethearchaeota archaeon]|nr:MAG: hypothetical protein E4G98_01020 [Candidatus Lokiarchaeota archaeon]